MTLPAAFLETAIAHRGLHNANAGRPENSIEAALAAIENGYGIECDVQVSSDGVPMVFHDDTLERLTEETGAIRARSAADLQSFNLFGGSSPMPTLSALLDLVAGRVPLIVELKDQDGALGEAVSPMEATTASLLNAYKGNVAVMSFNPNMIARMATLAPDVPRGLVTDPFSGFFWPDVPKSRREELAEIPDYDRVSACFISHLVDDLASPAVQKIKAKSASVLCWTVRSATQEAEARQIADNITFEGYLAEPRHG